eukprot:scaffold38106_cov49-Phaeocystis_antarctica.AAC.1
MAFCGEGRNAYCTVGIPSGLNTPCLTIAPDRHLTRRQTRTSTDARRVRRCSNTWALLGSA